MLDKIRVSLAGIDRVGGREFYRSCGWKLPFKKNVVEKRVESDSRSRSLFLPSGGIKLESIFNVVDVYELYKDDLVYTRWKVLKRSSSREELVPSLDCPPLFFLFNFIQMHFYYPRRIIIVNQRQFFSPFETFHPLPYSLDPLILLKHPPPPPRFIRQKVIHKFLWFHPQHQQTVL